MAIDDLLGAAVRIRRGWHGGRTGKVTVCDQHRGFTSTYVTIKVQLDETGQVIDINSVDELEELTHLPAGPAL